MGKKGEVIDKYRIIWKLFYFMWRAIVSLVQETGNTFLCPRPEPPPLDYGIICSTVYKYSMFSTEPRLTDQSENCQHHVLVLCVWFCDGFWSSDFQVVTRNAELRYMPTFDSSFQDKLCKIFRISLRHDENIFLIIILKISVVFFILVKFIVTLSKKRSLELVRIQKKVTV